MQRMIGDEMTFMGMLHTGEPCQRCSVLAPRILSWEMVMPLPNGALAPLSRYQPTPICHDCASAENLVGMGILPDFDMARIAVGNDRLEQLRLPGAPIGLVKDRLVRPSHTDDLNTLWAWHRQMGYVYEEDDE